MSNNNRVQQRPEFRLIVSDVCSLRLTASENIGNCKFGTAVVADLSI